MTGSSDLCSLNRLAVLHLTGAVGRGSFGVGAVALALADAQRRLAAAPAIWSCEAAPEIAEIRFREGLGEDELVAFPWLGPERLRFSLALERAAAGRQAERFAVVHQHGIWMAYSRFTNSWRAKYRRPTVVAPHGSLAPWALHRSRLKKLLARWAYERKNLAHVSCLHVLSEDEAVACREFGLTAPVAVIPNGIAASWLSSRGDPQAFRHRFGLPDRKRLLLFLGRITPIKGLPLLLQALAELRDRLDDWLVVFVGPDEFGHLSELQMQSERLQVGPLVRFVGPLFGQERRDAFAAAELFVLPSYSEGAPMAVYEAMGAGLPVITTVGAPCEYLGQKNCGWWTAIDSSALAAALEDALRRSPDELRAMGGRARTVVAERFVWEIAAQKTLELYRWLMEEGPQPDFVRLD